MEDMTAKRDWLEILDDGLEVLVADGAEGLLASDSGAGAGAGVGDEMGHDWDGNEGVEVLGLRCGANFRKEWEFGGKWKFKISL